MHSMTHRTTMKTGLILTLILGVSACNRVLNAPPANEGVGAEYSNSPTALNARRTTIWDAFRPSKTEQTVNVNKYIWNASLEVLNFLPVQTVDPFTGTIVTGYGTPPGGGRAYRATILVDDPALDARSLKLSLQNRNGRSANTATVRAVEDAILTRARQLRIADNRL